MDFTFFNLLEVLGALAFFIYGMKIMSDGIQRAAGSQLRNILRTMTKNRYLGVFTGFLTTAAVQSSSATTVMTVSFVNAGLLTLVESAGVMMGANIGTTITGWLVSILGFKVKLHTLSLPLFAVGLPMIFSNRSKVKYWGEFVLGFAVLFMGLSFLKGAVPDIKGNPEVLAWLQQFTEWGILSRIFFVFVGALVTIIVQSSSAAMTLTLTMCLNGWLPFDVAAAMVLGENIGTTITAELASLVGNVNAKRSARIHSMFNIIGVFWMILLMPWFLDGLSWFVQNVFNLENPYSDPESVPIAVSAFHTAFNLTNVLLLLAFVPLLVKLSIRSVKSKGDDDEAHRLRFIKSEARTPELATVELQKETAHFGEIVSKMSGFTEELIFTTEEKRQRKTLKKLKKYEEITDRMEIEITEYITKLTNDEMTPKTSLRLRSILNICNDLERIGDIYYQMSKTVERKIESKTWFDEEQRQHLKSMIDLTNEAFVNMMDNLNQPSYDTASLDKAKEIEKRINEKRNELRLLNQSRLGKKGYNTNALMIYNNLFSSFEKIGDHILNVNESIVGKI